MATKLKLDPNGLRDRRRWPTLTSEQQETLLEFLAYYRAVAETGYDAALRLVGIAGQDVDVTEQARYWARVVKACDWLMSRVSTRQRYLEVKQAIKEKRWVPPETERDT